MRKREVKTKLLCSLKLILSINKHIPIKKAPIYGAFFITATICLSGTSLVGVVHGVRVAPSLAFYDSAEETIDNCF